LERAEIAAKLRRSLKKTTAFALSRLGQLLVGSLLYFDLLKDSAYGLLDATNKADVWSRYTFSVMLSGLF